MLPRNQAWIIGLLIAGLSYGQNTSEREILADFFASCSGESWQTNENWLSDDSVCSWFGITCNEDSQLIELELPHNELNCEIPEMIFYLSSMKVFDVSGNRDVKLSFSDINPDQASDLTALYFSDADVDSLAGISTFSNLTALGAGAIGLTGVFPRDVIDLTNLKTLDLSHNFLTGNIPQEIGSLSNLRDLFLSNNLLTGTIPTIFGNLQRLSQLAIQFNDLTGPLPIELTRLPNLTYLTLNDQTRELGNGFTGVMLDFANSTFLLTLDVSNNQLTGTVPSNLLEAVDPIYSNLISVDMSGNFISGVVPASLSRFPAIRLYLSGNNIRGIDTDLCSQTGWFFGDVGEFGCDGILCPPGSFNLFGRQISSSFPCTPCSFANFYGATKCEALPEVRSRTIAHSSSEFGTSKLETKVSMTEYHSPIGDPETPDQLEDLFAAESVMGSDPAQGLNLDFLWLIAPPKSEYKGSPYKQEMTDDVDFMAVNNEAISAVAATASTPWTFLSPLVVCVILDLR